jgi:ACS family hexuronate transporter-like MFS transporter
MTRVRWWMLALLFFATTICYLDRIVLSFLAPEIRNDFRFTEQAWTPVYGYVTGAFQIAYMIGFLFAGRWIDRVGTRRGFAVAITLWSVAAGLHGLARTALPEWPSQEGLPIFSAVGVFLVSGFLSLAFWRAMLGLGESGNFPAAIKSVAEWFPAQDRAFATGLFNAGANVASMIGPPLLAVMLAAYGWRACFLITASVGFVWLVLWLATYHAPDQHPRVNRAELEYIHSGAPVEESGPRIGWKEALRLRETWGFALAKFLTDPVWWLYLWWLPLLLDSKFGLTPQQRGWALFVVYLMADVGSVLGGWISGFLMRRGWAHARARKTAMAMSAVCMPIGALAVLAPNPLLTLVLVSVVTSAHQGWSANLFTTTSDVFPKQAVASVVGIGGCAGALGGFLFSSVIPGHVIARFGYPPVFLAVGVFHLTALVLVHRLMRDMRKVSLDDPRLRG